MDNKHQGSNQMWTKRSSKRVIVIKKKESCCPLCLLSCENHYTLQKHMMTHSSSGVMQLPEKKDVESRSTIELAGKKVCSVCGKTFRNSSYLREHITCIHNRTSSFRCPICAHNIITRGKSIDLHMSNHASKIECPTCLFQAKNIIIIDKHITDQGAGHLKCRQCGGTFSDRIEFFCHVNDHIPRPRCDLSEPMTCRNCDESFYSTDDYNHHVKSLCLFKGASAEALEEGNPIDHSQHQIVMQSVHDINSPHVKGNISKTVISNVISNTSVQTSKMVSTVGVDGNTSVIMIPEIMSKPTKTYDATPSISSNMVNEKQRNEVRLNYRSCEEKNITFLYKTVERESAVLEPVEARQQNYNCVKQKEKLILPITSKEQTPLVAQNMYSLYDAGEKSSFNVNDEAKASTLKCLQCNLAFRDSDGYGQHIQLHNMSQNVKRKEEIWMQPESRRRKRYSMFECKDCGQSFVAKQHLDQHCINFHSDAEGILCPVCKKSIAGESSSLSEHLASIHNLRVDRIGKLRRC